MAPNTATSAGRAWSVCRYHEKVTDVPGAPGAWPPGPDPRLTRLDRLGQARSWSFPGAVQEFGASSVAGFDPVGAKRPGGSTADPYNPLLAGLYAGRR
jgi:hypothetical protein